MYKEKISKIDDLLKKYKLNNRDQLLLQRDSLKDKLDQGEKMLKKVKSSSEENYEQIKESALEVFDNVKEAFHDFSNVLSLEHLNHAKDEIVDYSNEKLDEMHTLIKKHPLTMAAWAVGVGFIIGTLFMRSK
ncbi:MAG: DUF883 family protein [Proteobacteria bacterium]|nr:DUF883 family protein [Pseudomonadota bacterium]